MNASAAHEGAVRMLAGAVARQSAVIAFEQVFLLTGLAFLCVLPLVYFLKRSPQPAPGAGARAEIPMEM
jgi:DHA2 family multidrug resistance protein